MPETSFLESHVLDITRLIQLTVAPVFLLTAIGTIINALMNRLGRAVDRRRQLEDLIPAYEGDDRNKMLEEHEVMESRIRLTLWATALAVTSALFVCLLIGFAFVGAFVQLDLSKTVAALFIAAMVALTGSLLLFLREVFLAATTRRHTPELQAILEARK
jgi:small-conductance mechanosensitive channel